MGTGKAARRMSLVSMAREAWPAAASQIQMWEKNWEDKYWWKGDERNSRTKKYKAGHNGEELKSNITHSNTTLLMWHIFNEERGACGN